MIIWWKVEGESRPAVCPAVEMDEDLEPPELGGKAREEEIGGRGQFAVEGWRGWGPAGRGRRRSRAGETTLRFARAAHDLREQR